MKVKELGLVLIYMAISFSRSSNKIHLAIGYAKLCDTKNSSPSESTKLEQATCRLAWVLPLID